MITYAVPGLLIPPETAACRTPWEGCGGGGGVAVDALVGLDCVPVTCEGCGFLHCTYSETLQFILPHIGPITFTHTCTRTKGSRTKLEAEGGRKSCGGGRRRGNF